MTESLELELWWMQSDFGDGDVGKRLGLEMFELRLGFNDFDNL